MNSADGLPPEDQAEFERVLDEVLLTARLTTGADPQEVARLRQGALDALPRIAAAAAAEYAHYERIRQQAGRVKVPDSPRTPGEDEAHGSGPGLVAVLCTLVPVLATVAAVVFLVLGHALGVADPEPAVAAPMRRVGWVFAVVAACGMLVAAAVLVGAAVRNGASTAIRASAPSQELARARAAWLRALLDRGITPYLREHSLSGTPHRSAHQPEGNPPRLRFSSPEFTSPDFSSPKPGRPAGPRYGRPEFSRPRFGHPEFSSPEFSSPDLGSRESTGPQFTHPAADETERADRRRFTGPDFSGPDLTSPAEGGQEPE